MHDDDEDMESGRRFMIGLALFVVLVTLVNVCVQRAGEPPAAPAEGPAAPKQMPGPNGNPDARPVPRVTPMLIRADEQTGLPSPLPGGL